MKDYVLEFDTVTGETFARGKDGRLFTEAEVAVAEDGAERGDAAARAVLIAIDFGLDADGRTRSRAETAAAIEADRQAWLRGDYDQVARPDGAGAGPGRGGWRRKGPRRARDRARNAALTPIDMGDPATAARLGILFDGATQHRDEALGRRALGGGFGRGKR